MSGSQLWTDSCGEEISFEDAPGMAFIEGMKVGKTAGNQERDGLYTLAKGKVGRKKPTLEVKGRSGQLNFTLWIFRCSRDLDISWISYLAGIPLEVYLAFHHISALCWWYWAVSCECGKFLLAPVDETDFPTWVTGWKSNTQMVGIWGFPWHLYL